jgi:SAM-dependent methyltransferase
MKAGFESRIHREKAIAGFTKLDGTVRFYSFVKAIMRDRGLRRVMDFGAGRGGFASTESPWRRELQDLRQYGAEVWACDIDEAVKRHPCSDHQIVIEPSQPLPFDSGSFDLIVSDFTFEHIEDSQSVASELLRVLRPGGVLCARTPNKYGYVKMASQLVPNSLHSRFLKRIQPDRLAEDIFPTVYKLNSVTDVRKNFRGCQLYWYRDSGEPAYYFGSSLLYRIGLLLHKLLPEVAATTICFFIVKE